MTERPPAPAREDPGPSPAVPSLYPERRLYTRRASGAEQPVEGQLQAAYRQLAAYALDLRRSLEAERESAAQLERERLEVVRRLLGASAARDAETGAHLVRIEGYVTLFAEHLGWSPERSAQTGWAAALHDVGKIGMPDWLLHKTGAFDESERLLMREHSAIGARILSGSSSPLLAVAEKIALSHHERWDGSGYPHGLRGEEIPLEARVVAVVDTYDALRSVRPYKRAYRHDEALAVLFHGDSRSAPHHFDPALLALLPTLAPKLATVWERSPGDSAAGRVLAGAPRQQ